MITSNSTYAEIEAQKRLDEPGKSGFRGEEPVNEIGEGWGAYNNGLSNCYLILKARAMGFDTLIMGICETDALRQLMSIPESETVMAVIAMAIVTLSRIVLNEGIWMK